MLIFLNFNIIYDIITIYFYKKEDSYEKIQIRDEYITLGQFLKFVGCVSSGIDAKMVIKDGLVLVNGEVETRRGKLRNADQIEFNGEAFIID